MSERKSQNRICPYRLVAKQENIRTEIVRTEFLLAIRVAKQENVRMEFVLTV